MNAETDRVTKVVQTQLHIWILAHVYCHVLSLGTDWWATLVYMHSGIIQK